MKARELQKHLGTDRCVHMKNGCIYVASFLCHELFELNVETGAVTYALAKQPANSDTELQNLMGALESLTATEREYYWNGVDDIENPITLYYIDDNGNVQTTTTDSLEFPSVTIDGVLIYENAHFKTKKEALESALSNTDAELYYREKSLIDQRQELAKNEARIAECHDKLGKIKAAISDL